MSAQLLSLLQRAVVVGVLLLVPLSAAYGFAPEETAAAHTESMAEGVHVLDLRGGRGDPESGDGWEAPRFEWPFGIPRWPDEPGVTRSDAPVQLAGDENRSLLGR